MICFPNAKINIGLNILRKREDKYHDLETLFYPIQLCDILEINRSDTFSFSQTGIVLGTTPEFNLAVKAWRLMQKIYNLPDVNIHLHKQIPFGAGLGGGSSDAAFTLMGTNQLFNLNLTEGQLLNHAAELGSDCPFFVFNRPVFAEEKGNIFTAVNLSLKGYYLVLVKPDIYVPTAFAYAKISPVVPDIRLIKLINETIKNWKGKVENTFETTVFQSFPEIAKIKNKLYEMGAVYASMSGSGSSVFGIFDNKPRAIANAFGNCFIWEEELS